MHAYIHTQMYAYIHTWSQVLDLEALAQHRGSVLGAMDEAYIQTYIHTWSQVLDLEGLAKHRGSVLGAMDEAQPSQKMFESLLLHECQVRYIYVCVCVCVCMYI